VRIKAAYQPFVFSKDAKRNVLKNLAHEPIPIQRANTSPAMNIEPCPHCYRKVIPMADGKCPSCGKKTADRTGVDPTRTLISIRTGDRLPLLCHNCATPTDRAKKFEVVSEPQDLTLEPIFGGGIARIFFSPFQRLAKMERIQKEIHLSVVLPTCRECALKIGDLTPRYIDFEDRRIDIIVHTDFKKAISQTR
jgi:hypothetical protein